MTKLIRSKSLVSHFCGVVDSDTLKNRVSIAERIMILQSRKGKSKMNKILICYFGKEVMCP